MTTSSDFRFEYGLEPTFHITNNTNNDSEYLGMLMVSDEALMALFGRTTFRTAEPRPAEEALRAELAARFPMPALPAPRNGDLSVRRAQYRAYGYSAREAHRQAMSDIREQVRVDLARHDSRVQEHNEQIECEFNHRMRGLRHPTYGARHAEICALATERLTNSWNERFPGMASVGNIRTFLDCGALEFNSPIITTAEQLTYFYEQVTTIGTGLGLRIRSETASSGGNHLHVTRRDGADWGSRFKWWLAHDASARPYVLWAFLDPEDDNIGLQPTPETYCDPINDYGSPLESGFIRTNTPAQRQTLENRQFEMPQTLEEQLLHVSFIDHWYAWIDQQIERRRLPASGGVLWASNRIMNWPAEKCLTHFARMLRTIGVPAGDREGMLRIAERNITTRESFLEPVELFA